MSLLRLAWQNIISSSYPIWLISLCSFIVTCLALCLGMLDIGAQASLQLAVGRIGADIVVVPEGAGADFQRALLMGGAFKARMPRARLAQIAGVPGVAVVSPQVYAAPIDGAACCSVDEVTLIIYEPGTDFTVTSLSQSSLGRPLSPGESVGGADIAAGSDGPGIKLFGYDLNLAGKLPSTGTNLDRTLLVTWDTAQEMAGAAQKQIGIPLELSPDDMSAALVKVAPGVKLHDVAVLTRRQVPGVTPIERSAMFQAYRDQLNIQRQAMTLLLILVLLLSLAIIALVSTAVANEQRQQVYVLRALGATRGFVLRTLLAAAGMLALAGAFLGSVLAVSAVYLLRDMLVRTVGVPYVAPSAGVMLPMLFGSLLLAFAMVSLAAFVPAYRVSYSDPAIAARK
jgi:putative ABC transport system permease protein